ncbi:MAG: sensor histidine kinase [Lachnoclostridium sp.]|nr:sensor histidine kinase [Lachnoclostridium sp.]
MNLLHNRRNITTFLTHLIVISILFLLPEVLWSLARPWKPVKPEFFIQALVYIAVFYIEYYAILRRIPSRPIQWWKFAGVNILLIAAILVTTYYIRLSIFGPGRAPKNPDHVTRISGSILILSRDFVMIVLTIALAVALRLGEQWKQFEKRRSEVLAMAREEELNKLKSQLNPHFLFNTLNSIYALIAISPEKAQAAIHELSRMLRYVLYDSPSTVPLDQEIDFVRNYLELMRLRLNPKLPLEVTLDDGGYGSSPIAPLLFITLIENVFKHGNTSEPWEPVYISITASAGKVTCLTSNAIRPASASSGKSGGIGLANLRRRLQLIYGDRAELVTTTADGRFSASLTIDLDTSDK